MSEKDGIAILPSLLIIYDNQIKQIDLLLDVWVDPWGTPLLLDEDEFEVDTTLR